MAQYKIFPKQQHHCCISKAVAHQRHIVGQLFHSEDDQVPNPKVANTKHQMTAIQLCMGQLFAPVQTVESNK